MCVLCNQNLQKTNPIFFQTGGGGGVGCAGPGSAFVWGGSYIKIMI